MSRNWKIGAWIVTSMVVGAGQLAAAQTLATHIGPHKGPQVPQGGGGPYACTIGTTILLDNGDTDGSNGYSNLSTSTFGLHRGLLDDFVVAAPGVVLDEFAWRHLWSAGGVGQGTGLEMSIRADAGGTPGAVMFTLTPTGYTEVATGRTWFGLPEAESHANLGGQVLVPGTYWFEMNVVGNNNNFVMIKAAMVGGEVWCNWDDFGFGSCSSILGLAPADLTWALCGTIVPVELQEFRIE